MLLPKWQLNPPLESASSLCLRQCTSWHNPAVWAVRISVCWLGICFAKKNGNPLSTLFFVPWLPGRKLGSWRSAMQNALGRSSVVLAGGSTKWNRKVWWTRCSRSFNAHFVECTKRANGREETSMVFYTCLAFVQRHPRSAVPLTC